MTDENQDEEWMDAVCRGDRQAFQAIVNHHHQAISHYAFRLLGNRADAEDITQETFLKLWINAGRWQPGKARLTTWLHRIAHNLGIDFLRKHSRLQSESDNSALEAMAELRNTDENPEDNPGTNAAQDSRLTRLQQCLNNLPEAQRSALMLCTFSGFSNNEAADIMGVSVKALESLLARARRNLRTTLSSGPLQAATARKTGYVSDGKK